jgi:virulence-associated protein VapD
MSIITLHYFELFDCIMKIINLSKRFKWMKIFISNMLLRNIHILFIPTNQGSLYMKDFKAFSRTLILKFVGQILGFI